MQFSSTHIRKVLYEALRQGLTTHKLSVTCAAGVLIGVFPVFGITTILCFAVAVSFRLNIPIIQLVNYLVAPLQLILIIPFIKVGTILFRLNPFPYNMEQMAQLYREDFFQLLKEAGLALTLGIGVWATFSIPLFFILYYLFFLLFRRFNFPQRELKSQ